MAANASSSGGKRGEENEEAQRNGSNSRIKRAVSEHDPRNTAKKRGN